jgi:putative ABC transport system permease protein
VDSPYPSRTHGLILEPDRPRRTGASTLDSLRVSLAAIGANRLRSALTMLGIIIGVGAVIVMVALGSGAARATKEAIKKLGTNRLYIRSQNQRTRGVDLGWGSSELLTLADAEALRRQARHISLVATELSGDDIRVEYGNRNHLCDVDGASPEYFIVRNLPIAEGRAFNNDEVERRARVAVLGHDVRRELFGTGPAVGREIRVKGQRFRVVGVTKRMGALPFGNRDDQVTVPITTAMRRLYGKRFIRSMSVQAVSLEQMDEAEEEIYEILRRSQRLRPEEAVPVRVSNQQDMVETANEQGAFMTMLLSGIALVSLVVGGIGVMNIMLVTVTERTREIGIRKALGARRSDILYQFLIEALTMCVLGGLIGITAGILVANWMALPADQGGMGMPMLMTLPPIVVSFLSSAVVGIIAGTYPAVKAAMMDPIQALRHE